MKAFAKKQLQFIIAILLAFGLSFSKPCSAVNTTVNSSNITLLGAAAATTGIASLMAVLFGQSSNKNIDTSNATLPPTVTHISPNIGPLSGKTTLIITGTNFTGATTVNFDHSTLEIDGINAIIDSDTQITVKSIPTAEIDGKIVYVSVTTPGGTSAISEECKFTYSDQPTINMIYPNIGKTTGGSSVTISGTNFYEATAVKFGSITLPSDSWHKQDDDNTIQIISSPSGEEGTVVDITVTTPAGTSAISEKCKFTYSDKPIINTIYPNIGKTAGGSSATISGYNFNGATAVKFGSITLPSDSWRKQDDNTIQITSSPSGKDGEVVDIIVTTPAGTSAISEADKFTYHSEPPEITKLMPNTGKTVGGSSLKIRGKNFEGVTEVKFGSITLPRNSWRATSNINIDVLSLPPGTEGTVDVTVTTPAGTSAISSSDEFTYYSVLPLIFNISPGTGITTGGSSTRITGKNFEGVTEVKFGSITLPRNSWRATSDNYIDVLSSPPGPEGTVDVTVTTPTGTSEISEKCKFTYVKK